MKGKYFKPGIILLTLIFACFFMLTTCEGQGLPKEEDPKTKPQEPPVLVSIQVVQEPDTIEYLIGEVFSPEGMAVRAYYTQNVKKWLTYNEGLPTDYTYEPTGELSLEDTFITIYYEGLETTVDITVSLPQLSPEELYFSKDFDTSVCSFYDKFEPATNATAGGVNLDKWGFQNGNGSEYGISGWGNSERQAYRTENVTVTDGILTINAKYVSPQVNSRSYTSGKIVTANSKGLSALGEPAGGTGKKFGQTYGRFEAKIRMNADIGAWPALWMMPVDGAYGGWPKSGEIDIMEMTGDRNWHSSSTIHCANSSGGQQYRGVNRDFLNGSTYSDWHVYGIIWKPTEMVLLLDGYSCRTIARTWWNTTWYANNGFTGNDTIGYPPYNKDFHFIINLALDSGAFRKENAIDNTRTTLNYTMDVEWVRAYTLENDPWEILGTYPGKLGNY